ncbi:MAG TPA: glycosyltransferase family 9 protein [Acidobacteriota bacterium]|jgi:ADP-heptose:LPS heptosyltransferase
MRKSAIRNARSAIGESAIRNPKSAMRISPAVQEILQVVQKVLLVRLRSLGDAVLMTPVPGLLKAWRTSLHIAVLIEEPFAAVFRHHPDVDEVISLPPRSSLLERLRCIWRIRQERFDMVLNMHSGPTAGLLTVLSGAPVRVAYSGARYVTWCNVKVPGSQAFWNAARIHTVEHQVSPLLHLGVPVPEEIELVVGLDCAAQQRVQQRMGEIGIRPGQYILMQPFAVQFTKEWDGARFVELARRLREKYQVPVIAAAGPSESEKLRRLVSAGENTIIGLFNPPLEELIVWIDQCGLFVGNDSGPTHIAAARKKKIVVLWGSSDYHAWHPWAADYQLLRADLPCIPCPGDRCYQFDTPKCIESISVDHAFHAAMRLQPFS